MEIERKYLVTSDAFRTEATHVYHIEQGYISVLPTVRVRIRGAEAFITIKDEPDTAGLMRQEWEYPIPRSEAEQMMLLCQGRTLKKDRYIVPHEGHVWEVDVFSDRHEGLVLAEIELSSPSDVPSLPTWVGEEVTGQSKYYNAVLCQELSE